MNVRRFTLGIGLLCLLLLPLLRGTPSARGAETSPQGGASVTAVAEAAIELLERVQELLLREAEAGELEEAQGLLDRFEALLAAVRDFLVEAAGKIAQEELAEIETFLPRLRQALEDGDLSQVQAIVSLIKRELEEIEAALIGPAATASEALDHLEELLDKIEEEIDEGEFAEALVFVERFEGLLEANRQLLIDAAGEVAQEELAEIEQFIERLEDALEAEDAAEAKRIIALIRHELEEVREALEGRAGVEVEIGSAEVAAGERVTVPLKVERLEVPLGAYNFTVRFDPAVVQAREVTVRYGTALPAPLIDNDRGTVRLQGIEPAAPQTGELVIAEFTFEAVGAPGAETELQITVEELADPDGEPIEVGTVENGRIAVP